MQQLSVSVDNVTNYSLSDQCRQFVTVKLATPEDFKSLVAFVQAIYNGTPTQLLQGPTPLFLGDRFRRIRLTVPYFHSNAKLNNGETYEMIFQQHGRLDVAEWIPEIFNTCYPMKSKYIHGMMDRLFDTATNYNSNQFILTSWNGEIISFASGISPLRDTDGTAPTDTYSLFGMPFDKIHPSDLLDVLNAEPYPNGYRRQEYTLSGSKPRVVIGKKYFRFNSFELTDDNFSLLLHTDNLVNISGATPSIHKSKAFDYRLSTLLFDESSNRRTLDLDYHPDYRDISNLPNVEANGLVMNMDVLDSAPYFNKLCFTEEELHDIRVAIGSKTNRYLRASAGISFSEHLNKKKQKISLHTFSGNFLGILTKSSEKRESEEKTFKTRVLTSITSYLLSIAYSVILHNDLELPDDCYLDTLSFRRMLVRSGGRRRSFSPEVFMAKEYMKDHTIELTEARKEELQKCVRELVIDFVDRDIKVSPNGGMSVITSYCYEPKVPRYYNATNQEFCWLTGLDASTYSYYGHHFAGLARGNNNGVNPETQAISAAYFLKTLRYTNKWDYDPTVETANSYIATQDPVHEYRQALAVRLNKFYLDNVFPNTRIDEAFAHATENNDFIPQLDYEDIEIRYVELFTLQEDSLAILKEGYASKSLPSILGWWSYVSGMLKAKAASDPRYRSRERILLAYLLDSTDYIVTCLTDKVDELI